MIKHLRKVLPQIIAESIVGVQPMDNVKLPFGNRTFLTNGPKWESWKKKLVFIPRKSIYGKFVFGWINRSSKDEFEVPFGAAAFRNSKRFHRYANNKELFKATLKGEA